ncbi:hypothetical protein D3C71_1719030 [compost metagenome]
MDRSHGQSGGQVRLAHARRSQQHHVLGALQEGQAGQLHHLRLGHAAGESEVELLQGLHRRQGRQFLQRLPGALGAGIQLGPQGLLQEVAVAGLQIDGTLCQGGPLGGDGGQSQLLAQRLDAFVLQAHAVTSISSP